MNDAIPTSGSATKVTTDSKCLNDSKVLQANKEQKKINDEEKAKLRMVEIRKKCSQMIHLKCVYPV